MEYNLFLPYIFQKLCCLTIFLAIEKLMHMYFDAGQKWNEIIHHIELGACLVLLHVKIFCK